MKLLGTIPEFTFDDVLVLPGHASIAFSEENTISLDTHISAGISLRIPIITSPMTGVTEDRMAILIGSMGGFGFIHHFQSVSDQADQVKKTVLSGCKVGASIGEFDSNGLDRIRSLLNAGASIISLESAQADNVETLAFIRSVKKKYRNICLSVAHVVTGKATESVIRAGADSVRVGIGGGSHCSTRLVTGTGRPQLSAVRECAAVARKHKIPIISDGGIKYSGDIVKALACGADAVMIGGLLSGTTESPGPVFERHGRQYKMTWGNCTASAIRQRHILFKRLLAIDSIRRFKRKLFSLVTGAQVDPKVVHDLLEEGVENAVPFKGSAQPIIQQLIDGVRRGMWYAGAKNIRQLADTSTMVMVSGHTVGENMTRI